MNNPIGKSPCWSAARTRYLNTPLRTMWKVYCLPDKWGVLMIVPVLLHDHQQYKFHKPKLKRKLLSTLGTLWTVLSESPTSITNRPQVEQRLNSQKNDNNIILMTSSMLSWQRWVDLNPSINPDRNQNKGWQKRWRERVALTTWAGSMWSPVCWLVGFEATGFGWGDPLWLLASQLASQLARTRRGFWSSSHERGVGLVGNGCKRILQWREMHHHY